VSVAVAAVVATSLRLVVSHAYVEGAPPGFSGGFKEDSCHACHFHAELNSGSGRVTLAGVPASFAPGERYTVTVTLQHTAMKLAGIQLTARFADGGKQAGALSAPESDLARVRVETYEGVQYANHNKAGTSVDKDEAATWTIVWTAPLHGGPVFFHVSANAADGNGNAEGDFIYTAMARAAPAPPPRWVARDQPRNARMRSSSASSARVNARSRGARPAT
jgi:hypothetical protein